MVHPISVMRPPSMNDAIESARKLLLRSLPNESKWQFRDTWVSFDFSRLRRSLPCITQEPITGTIPQEWQRYHVFGNELFENGSAFLCFDELDGSVRRIDVELAQPVSLMNASICQFTDSFQIWSVYFSSEIREPEELARQLRAADRDTYDAGSQWRLLSDCLRDCGEI